MSDRAKLIRDIEAFICKYVTLADLTYSLPLALWIVATFCYESFDAFPYLVITSPTKRSGKTRLLELLAFACSNPRHFAAMTGPTIFKSIQDERPTIFCDEAEELSKEAAGTMRSVLNVGYRKGATIPRTVGTKIMQFPTYCPKVFTLIGDPFDTLKDRSIIVTMRRAEAPERFTWAVAEDEGAKIRQAVIDFIIDPGPTNILSKIQDAFANHKGLPFLQDRDEEIWTSLFCIAEVFCPSRLDELQRTAVDMATEKTADSKKYTVLANSDKEAQADEYRIRLLMDLFSLFLDGSKAIPTARAVESLKALPVAPWRKFRGKGLTGTDLSNMLRAFGVHPVNIRNGHGRGSAVLRGYKRADVELAVKENCK